MRKERSDGIAKNERSGICPKGRASKYGIRREEKVDRRMPYFSREPTCNYELRATIYDKTKKETSKEISFFVVRSTGIEPKKQSRKPFIYKAFRHFLPKHTPI